MRIQKFTLKKILCFRLFFIDCFEFNASISPSCTTGQAETRSDVSPKSIWRRRLSSLHFSRDNFYRCHCLSEPACKFLSYNYNKQHTATPSSLKPTLLHILLRPICSNFHSFFRSYDVLTFFESFLRTFIYWD